MATELIQSTGKVVFLRAHEVGSAYGPPGDQIDVEVVVRLDSVPDRAMGFRMRNDANRLAHRAMFDLLRAAFEQELRTTIDYYIDLDAGDNNGRAIRAWLTK